MDQPREQRGMGLDEDEDEGEAGGGTEDRCVYYTSLTVLNVRCLILEI